MKHWVREQDKNKSVIWNFLSTHSGWINEEYTAVKLRALWVRKMVLVVHDLEMRGSKLHLIHNYKDLKGGGIRRRENTLRDWKMFWIWNHQNTKQAQGLKDELNVAGEKKARGFTKILAFVLQYYEKSLSSLFTWSRYFVAVVMDLVMFVSVQFSLCNEKLLRDDF